MFLCFQKSNFLYPKLTFCQSLVKAAESSTEKYDAEKDRDLVVEDDGVRDAVRDWVFGAGQSKRIWNELYKVGMMRRKSAWGLGCGG